LFEWRESKEYQEKQPQMFLSFCQKAKIKKNASPINDFPATIIMKKYNQGEHTFALDA